MDNTMTWTMVFLIITLSIALFTMSLLYRDHHKSMNSEPKTDTVMVYNDEELKALLQEIKMLIETDNMMIVVGSSDDVNRIYRRELLEDLKYYLKEEKTHD